MVIFVGLGNIGPQYQNTFHNLGFMFADRLAEKLGFTFSKEKYKAIIAEGNFNGEKILIAKPTTFMNNSGESVVMLKNKFKDARIIVAVDDIDIEKGLYRYRERGSAGTHNGLRSIVSYIGEEFERVRIGTGRDKSIDLVDFVLSKIKNEDKEVFDTTINQAIDFILKKITEKKVVVR